MEHTKEMTQSHEVVLSFFFHVRGTDLQRFPFGMYRALIHQLLPQFPDEFSALSEKYKSNTDKKGEAWEA